MNNLRTLAPVVALLLACATESAGTQTGGSGGNPCQIAEADWAEVSGALPQVGTWRGEVEPSEGGRTSAILTVEQTGPLLRSDALGCGDLQRANIEYTLAIDGVFTVSREEELVDRWRGSADLEAGYVGLLTTRIDPSGIDSGVHVPTSEEFMTAGSAAGAPNEGMGGAGGTGSQDDATPRQVDLSVEVVFGAEGARANLTWVCLDCDEGSHVVPLGVALLEQD